jgi:ATP-dependent phosphoenolpyruvate carboxykinase
VIVDCVVNAASSDHRAAVEAIIAGLSGSGKTFLHTSGARYRRRGQGARVFA